jgi:hypothetical protein
LGKGIDPTPTLPTLGREQGYKGRETSPLAPPLEREGRYVPERARVRKRTRAARIAPKEMEAIQ